MLSTSGQTLIVYNMKYLPTVNLWNPAINAAIKNKQLKLQAGQWVLCGNDKPSRFVRVSKGGSIFSVHPNGKTVSNNRFKDAINHWPK